MDQEAAARLGEEIAALEGLLAAKKRLLAEVRDAGLKPGPAAEIQSEINNRSPVEAKIALFRSLFKGREDLYAKRFESGTTGKSGYQPACRHEWVRGICEKPRIRCGTCGQRAFEPVSDEVIRCHLAGFSSGENGWGRASPFVMGIYPLLQDETCNFLAVDFDKEAWREDAGAFMETCKLEGIDAVLERSRSGNGGHVWIFFDKPIRAAKARKLGSFLMTRTLDRRPEIGLD